VKIGSIFGVIFMIIVNAFFLPLLVLSATSHEPIITVASFVSYVAGLASTIALARYLNEKSSHEVSVLEFVNRRKAQHKAEERPKAD
jgi:cytochrome c biogenesis protein CcdA